MSDTLHDIGQDAGKLAREHVTEPARDLIHDASTAVQQGARQARNIRVADADQAQESLSRLCRQTGCWIAVNPFTSVGLALLAGAAMGLVARSTRAAS